MAYNKRRAEEVRTAKGVFFFSKEQEIPDQKQNQKTKKMTSKESDSLNLHNFLPTKGKIPRLPHAKQNILVASESFALRATTTCCATTTFGRKAISKAISVPRKSREAISKAIKQSTRNDLSEKKNSVLLNASSNLLLVRRVTSIASSASKARKQHKQLLDNIKKKHALKPVRSCWVENRNNNGKPFNSALGKQPSFSSNKLLEKDQRSPHGKPQFQKKTLLRDRRYTNRTQIKTPRDFDKAKTGVIYLTYTSNNTVCTLVDFKGVTKGWSSCGSLGFKSARKSTAYASQATTERIGLKAKEVGFKWAFLVLKGIGRGKESGVRALRKSGIEILGILEKTGIPHNGCRAPRKRRI